MLQSIIAGVVSSLVTMAAKLASQKVIAIAIMASAKELAKRTKNTIDDDTVSAWEKELKESGVL